MDVRNAVEGKLVAVGAILIDVSDSQTRQLLHRFVITGDGSEFNGRQIKTLAVHTHGVNGKQG